MRKVLIEGTGWIYDDLGIEPYYNAGVAISSSYDKGEDVDFSASGLSLPPQLYVLKKHRWQEIKIPISDLTYAIDGAALHLLLEQHADNKHYRVEERCVVDLDGVKISGKPDLWQEGGYLIDWKRMSVWEAIYGLNIDKEAQANVYAWLIKKSLGIHIEDLRIVGIFRDYSKGKALREGPDSDYPQAPVKVMSLPRWEDSRVEAYIRERVTILQKADEMYPELLPCTREDQWRTVKYAVTKAGRSRSIKNFDSKADAQAWMAQQNDAQEMFIEDRVGEPTRCLQSPGGYCPVRAFCPQALKERGK